MELHFNEKKYFQGFDAFSLCTGAHLIRYTVPRLPYMQSRQLPRSLQFLGPSQVRLSIRRPKKLFIFAPSSVLASISFFAPEFGLWRQKWKLAINAKNQNCRLNWKLENQIFGRQFGCYSFYNWEQTMVGPWFCAWRKPHHNLQGSLHENVKRLFVSTLRSQRFK